MRANTDELADQILDIIERHIRLDPDDEGDPGEAARRIIDDIIVPITDGEAVTTTDHAAALEASEKRPLLPSCCVSDHAEDDRPDEQDDADDREPDEALDREADHGQHGPDDEKDDQYGPHVGNRTAVRAGTEQSEMREQAKRLRRRTLIPRVEGSPFEADLVAGADALDRLADVVALHIPQQGSQGYLPNGQYGWIDEVCPKCGNADEYGIASPCPTLAVARGETNERESNA